MQNYDKGLNQLKYNFKNYKPFSKNTSLSLYIFSYWNWLFKFSNILKEQLPKDKNLLRLIRNEVYARHGYRFDSLDLHLYFSAQPWYKIDNNFEFDSLNNSEKHFVKTVKELEESL